MDVFLSGGQSLTIHLMENPRVSLRSGGWVHISPDTLVAIALAVEHACEAYCSKRGAPPPLKVSNHSP